MACRACVGKDLRAMPEISSTCGFFDSQRARTLELRASGNASRQPAHVRGERSHLAALERQRSAVHAALHTTVDAIFERIDRALPRAVLWELPPNAHEWHGIGL